MPQPGERRAVRLFADACHECWRVVQDPVLKRPGAAPRFARALAMMAQIGEPDVEAGGAEKIRHPCVQPEAEASECPAHETNSGAPIANRARAGCKDIGTLSGGASHRQGPPR